MREHTRYLNGDLNQIGIQKRYLETECVGFDLVQDSGFVPGLASQSEYERAINCFWNDKVHGWWNYKDDLIKYLVCDEDEFKTALKKSCERK
jgi:hypothetical protein